MNRVHIALGGNLGDVATTMDDALNALDQLDDVRVGSVSRLYETAPVGAAAGGVFLNAAAELSTSSAPAELLQHLKQTEHSLGRLPADRWSSRRIDLDLLLAGDVILDTPALKLPHPHLWYRRFVLDPLIEVAGDVVHPIWQVTISELHADLQQRPLTMTITGGCAEDRLAVGSILQRAGVELMEPEGHESGPLRLQLVSDTESGGAAAREIDLAALPGSVVEAAQSVLTAMLDEPTVHSRPLRRMP